MLYVSVTRNEGKAVSANVAAAPHGESRWDWKTFDMAQEVAALLGAGYVATDAGAHVSPRYDVIKLPQVGDKVSYAFNGDSYPCGVVKSISKSLRKIVAVENGAEFHFYRVRQSGSWRYNRTWSLQAGHVSKQNPSF